MSGGPSFLHMPGGTHLTAHGGAAQLTLRQIRPPETP